MSSGMFYRERASVSRRRECDRPAPRKERVMYPSKQKALLQKVAVVGGEPITEELAIGLRQVVFGTPVTTPRSEWLRTGLVFREADQELGFGLKAARNGTRGLLSVVQAHVLKHLLFHKDCGPSPDKLLKPCRARQLEALWTSLSDILWRVGEKAHCRVCLPQEEVLVPHSHKYFQDGLTEKLHIFEFTNYEDLFVFIKRYTFLFAEDNGPGTLLLLYCAVLTRGCGKVKLDLGSDKAFLVTAAEEGSQCVVTLLLTGRATPYLHNGVVYVGDEDHYALPQFGVLARSEVGFLLWEEDGHGKMDEARQPGSRLKTPSVPVWVCCCLGHYGVLFNTNSELLRNYQAERRFDLYYYTCGGNMSVLSVDTRCSADTREARDDMGMPSLEKLIHTKCRHPTFVKGPGGYLTGVTGVAVLLLSGVGARLAEH